MKIVRIFQIADNELIGDTVYAELCPVMCNMIWKCNLAKIDVENNFPHEEYWFQVLVAWSEINFEMPRTKGDILNQIIWWNSFIKVGNKPICWSRWVAKGIYCIEDIVSQNGDFLPAEELGVPWIDYCSLKTAIPQEWKKILRSGTMGKMETKLYDKLSVIQKPNRVIYDLLIHDDTHLQKYVNRWNETGLTLTEVELEKCFKQLHKNIKVIKYKSFQYRLLLKKITTNVELKQWKI